MVVEVAQVTDASTFEPISPKHPVRAQMLQQIHIFPHDLGLMVFMVKPY